MTLRYTLIAEETAIEAIRQIPGVVSVEPAPLNLIDDPTWIQMNRKAYMALIGGRHGMPKVQGNEEQPDGPNHGVSPLLRVGNGDS